MKQKKILLIDDEKNIVDLLKERLTANGYSVTTAGNGKEGLEKLKTTSPDLIVLDMLMPEMDGFTFLKIIKKKDETANIPVLVLTCRGHMRDTFNLFDVDEFIVKPFEAADLLAKIDFLTKLKVLVLTDNNMLVNSVERAATGKNGMVEAVGKEEALIEKARKDRYNGVIIHAALAKQKPDALIQNIKAAKNKKIRILVYSNYKEERASFDPDAALAAKKTWEKAGANIFFDSLLEKTHFGDILNSFFALLA